MTGPKFTQLLSHRLRGFDVFESTIHGLQTALQAGVGHIEVDVRVTKDGEYLVYHDAFVRRAGHTKAEVSSLTKAQILDSEIQNYRICDLKTFLAIFSESASDTVNLYLDIKDEQVEGGIVALVEEANLSDCVTYISWTPNVLYRLHKLSPGSRLCFSHFTFSKMPYFFKYFAAVHKFLDKTFIGRGSHFNGLYFSSDGTVEPQQGESSRSNISAVVIPTIISGNILSLLSKVKGGVCIPRQMVSKELVKFYTEKDIYFSSFSYSTKRQLRKTNSAAEQDLYFIDNAELFFRH